MRTEKHFFEHVAAYGKPPEATPTPGADPGSEDDHESAEVTESEAESQHDDQDDSAVFVEPVRVDREIQTEEQPKSVLKPAKQVRFSAGFDNEEMWRHLDHPENPFVVAKRMVKRYTKKLEKWKIELDKQRKTLEDYLNEEDPWHSE